MHCGLNEVNKYKIKAKRFFVEFRIKNFLNRKFSCVSLWSESAVSFCWGLNNSILL
ncbi:hypothetical protein SAMN04487979_103217 [Flavobacterium sp. ov086]|nr:hypothetical protein SAMN04487979_103217 [Flavobacterium sp. ov086]